MEKRRAENRLTPTMEDYLEAICNVQNEKRVVRVRDIAKKLGVKMPTVTNMLKNLNNQGYIDYEKYEFLELTDKGVSVGEEMQRRHRILRSFLNDILKIEFEKADREACRLEHAISPTTLDSLVDFMEFIQTCPRAGMEWLDHFGEFRSIGVKPDKCLTWFRKASEGIHVKSEKPEDVES